MLTVSPSSYKVFLRFNKISILDLTNSWQNHTAFLLLITVVNSLSGLAETGLATEGLELRRKQVLPVSLHPSCLTPAATRLRLRRRTVHFPRRSESRGRRSSKTVASHQFYWTSHFTY